MCFVSHLSCGESNMPLMGLVKHPKLYDPATMVTLKAAFHEVWTTVEADGSRGDPLRDEDCKAAIIRRLLDLAASGCMERSELVAKLLSHCRCPEATLDSSS